MPVRFKPHLLLISLTAAAAFIACGSDDGGGTDGTCSQGDTRACLGPGQCNGAQSCTADGAWSACDCGGTGGSGGTGGTGGTGGAAGGDGSAGTGGSAGDASADGAGGGTQWKDDPCPTKKPIIDCSTGCGGPSASCETATCGFYEYGPQNWPPEWPPHVIRTPSKPGVNAKCAALCPGAGIVYGIAAREAAPIQDITKGMVVKVPKPWSVFLGGWKGAGPKDLCSAPTKQCAVMTHTAPDVLIVTTDPNAPAVNITLEEVPWPGDYCP
jgi:hypothetical protein